jgi:pimeloyl-ACP methyl ester carboxylesterase
LPRWRGWCAGGPPEMRATAEAANCRSRVFAAYYREWSQMPQSAADVRAVKNLGTVPLVVISRDPSLGHDREVETRHAQQQPDMLKLSANSRLIVAEGSGHDIPGMRPDVVIEAVRSLVRPPVQADSRATL